MSWTSPLTVASTMRALPPAPSTRSMCGSRRATAVFMRLGRLQHERQLHRPEPNIVADDLHPGQQVLVDDVQRRVPGIHRSLEVVVQAVAVAVDDAPREALVSGSATSAS